MASLHAGLYIAMHVSPILKNKLLIGSCPITAGDVGQLKAEGITAVLNLQTDEDLKPREIDWPAMTDAYRATALRSAAFRSPISRLKTCGGNSARP